MKPNKRQNHQKNILVIGGYGYIGRHVVKHLQRRAQNVIIGTRKPKNNKAGKTNERQIALHKLKTVQQTETLLEGIDTVINAVGILRQRFNESYQQVHHQAVNLLAQACANTNTRLVHVSALGLNNPVKSRFLTSKLKGEHVIKQSNADWYIVRPSLVDGEGGFGAKWFRRVAKWPIHFAPDNAKGLITPINVDDLGEAIANIALKEDKPKNINKRIFELGGDQKYDLLGYLTALNGGISKISFLVPAGLVRMLSHIFDVLHITPLSFGHYELLQRNNCPTNNSLKELLNRPSRNVIDIVTFPPLIEEIKEQAA